MMDNTSSDASIKSGIGYVEFVFLTTAMTAVIAMSIDIILPALVILGSEFNLTNPNHPQFVISVFAISFGVSQLLFGPLSDVFGRKPIIYFGLIVFALASLFAAFTTSFSILIGLRLVQGFGAAAVRVGSAAIVRDCFSGRNMARVMSFVFAALMIVPILAPAIGQVILSITNWHWVFIFLGQFGCTLFAWTYFRLNETLPVVQRRPFKFGPVIDAFKEIITNRLAFGYTMAATLFFGALFAFVTSMPQIVDVTYGRGDSFALFFAISAMFSAIGSLLNSGLVERFGMRLVANSAMIFYTLVALTHLAITLLAPPNIWLMIALVSAMTFNLGLIFSNFNSIAMEPLGHVAGSASAVMGGVTFAGGAFLGGIAGQMFDGTTLPMVCAFALFGLCAIVIIIITERGRIFSADPS